MCVHIQPCQHVFTCAHLSKPGCWGVGTKGRDRGHSSRAALAALAVLAALAALGGTHPGQCHALCCVFCSLPPAPSAHTPGHEGEKGCLVLGLISLLPGYFSRASGVS